MNNRFQNIQGYIFDLDGTLVSSSIDFPALQTKIGCEIGADILKFLDSQKDPLQRNNILRIIEETELIDAQSSQIINGVALFLDKLVRASFPVAIVTRNFSTAAKAKIRRAELPIELVLTREDAPPKPDPAALLHIAKQWKMQPQHLAYVGDYHFDIDAAKNAGMHACFYNGGRQTLPQYASRADYVFHDYQAFSVDVFGS